MSTEQYPTVDIPALAIDTPPNPPVQLYCALAGCTTPPAVQWSRRSATDPTSVEAVFACTDHAITLDLAALVHQPTCTAPNLANLPLCDCTPEPAPAPEPLMQDVRANLPASWVPNAA